MSTKKLLLFVYTVFFMGSFAIAQAEYIGASKCKMCHNKEAKGKQYEKWANGPHAKALKTLASEEAKKYSDNPQKDAKCLKCHSTYYSDNTDLMYTIKEDEGVSCESCHGPGSEYKSNTVMKDRQKSLDKGMIDATEAVCKKCHNEESPTFKGFNYAEYKAKIAHPIPPQE